MVFLMKYIFLVIIVSHYCVAIKLGFFNLPIYNTKKLNSTLKRIRPSSTTTELIITANNNAALTIETQNVIQPPDEKHELEEEIQNVILPTAENPELEEKIQNVIQSTAEKHELEEETSLELENSAECMDENPNYSGQEIDESRNFTQTNTTCGRKNSGIKNDVINVSSDLNTEKNELKFLKVPLLKEKKIIKKTTTIIIPVTKYKTTYPSCLKMNNIKSICDGALITLYPTPILQQKGSRTLNNAEVSEDMEMSGENEDEDRNIRPTATTVIVHTTSTVASHTDTKMNILEPSETDYEFEESRSVNALSTPVSESVLDESDDAHSLKPANIIEKLIGKPEIKFETKYLLSTTVKTVMNLATRATVIAKNCLPADINIPLCDPRPFLHLQDFLKKHRKHFQSSSVKFSDKVSTTNTDDVLDQLNQYLIMNADRIIDRTGFETINLNSDATIIESSKKIQNVNGESSGATRDS